MLLLFICLQLIGCLPITVAAPSEAWNIPNKGLQVHNNNNNNYNNNNWLFG
jgi:hypothetical protein